MRHHPLTPPFAVSPIHLDSLDNRDFLAMFLGLAKGRVAERLKAPDSKSGVRETVPWVQIPPLPPEPEQLTKTFLAILRFSGLGRVPFSTIEILALGALIW